MKTTFNKTEADPKRIPFLSVAFLLIKFLSLSISQAAPGNEAGIMEAYQLRMNGQADKAAVILQEMLNSDSTNALACFELARTRHHIFLGAAQMAAGDWTEVTRLAGMAARYAPDNQAIGFYYAYCCFFDAFISMMTEKNDARDKILKACDRFNNVLGINPGCYAAKLYLIDIYGFLPEELGGNRAKAESIAAGMQKDGPVPYAIAYAKLLPDTADLIGYWQKMSGETGKDARIMEELGRAYLLKSDGENGTRYFQEAMATDPSRQSLALQLVRYHLMSTQQEPDKKTEHLEKAMELLNAYLNAKPEPPRPLKAYTYGMMALIKMVGGDNESAGKYRDMATSMDPNYSKATGMPSEMIFYPPDQVTVRYSSFFLPF